MAKTLSELFEVAERSGCQEPDCTHAHDNEPLTIHSRCHPAVPMWAVIEPKTRQLRLKCAVCDRTCQTIQGPPKGESAQLTN